MKIDGRCHCGFIAFEADADPEQTMICHCTDCQTLSGSAFRTVVPVPAERFKMTGGEPAVYIKIGDSGNKRVQSFCPRCGSPIYASDPGNDPKAYNVRVGVIRQRDRFAPKVQKWARSKQRWISDIASAPEVEKQ